MKVERQGSLPQDVAKQLVSHVRSHGRKQYRKKLVLKGKEAEYEKKSTRRLAV